MSVSSGVLAELADLQARVAALEGQTIGVDESIQPNYLTYDPATGAIGASFPGGVSTQEQTGGTFSPDAGLAWAASPASSATGLVEFVYGYYVATGLGAGEHILELASIPGYPSVADFAILQLIADLSGSSGESSIGAAVKDSSSGLVQGTTLIDSAGRSSYLLASEFPPIWSTVGNNTVTWAAGQARSNALNVALPGASGNVFGVAVCASTPVVDGIVMMVQTVGDGTVNFYGTTSTLDAPGAGATAGFNYVLWGS